ncbi:MAG: 4-hydroxy-tetrahydrodipicolinate synthase [Lactobacillales bacterium]|jgi:4-hydroxy-tetrahydrodipicolinate synthase|nr:4-hydroxy-tetrahydrodipicolinate synthase [Lactobacillales bacterium]
MPLENVKIITAMVTPFNEDGTIAFHKLGEIVEHLLANKTDAIILAGTTGESPTLTHEEEFMMFNEVIRLVDGRVPLICGVGTNDTRDSVEFVKKVSQVKGIAAGLAVVPYYNKPSQAGLLGHFSAIAEASDLPIILYNVPGRTVVSLDVDTTLELAKHPNIIATKECGGLGAISELVEGAPDGFRVYTGNDDEAFASYCIGCDGVVSVASHLFGNETAEMFAKVDAGEIKAAAAIQRKLLPKQNALFMYPSPAPVKAGLNDLGVEVGGLRLPLVALNDTQRAEVLDIFKK